MLGYNPAMAVAAKSGPLEVTLSDLDATAGLAARVAACLRPGDVVALYGDLGTGKTAFARALVRTLCGPDEEVPSPTFTLVQTYAAPDLEIWHFDLYRLERPEDALELGLDEALANGAAMIEWPERLGRHLPPDRLEIRFAYGGTEAERTATLAGRGGWAARLRELGLE